MADQNTDIHSRILKNDTERKKRKAEFYAATIRELRTAERFVNYFKQFEPKSVEAFIKSYARQKAGWFDAAESLKAYHASREKEYMEECFAGFNLIQQKKLFDLQCRWRAEQVKAEGIEICFDFQYWERLIFTCPAISPVTEEDIALFVRFLHESPPDEPFDNVYSFQNYDELIPGLNNPDGDENYHRWYKFHNAATDNGDLIQLPDLRGKKEDFYISLYHKNDREKRKEEIEARNRQIDPRPYLSRYKDDFHEKFIKANESLAYQRLYEEFKNRRSLGDMNDDALLQMSYLAAVPKKHIPVVPAGDWRDAVCMTWEQFRRESVIALMSRAYELYLAHVGEDWMYPGRRKPEHIGEAEYDRIRKGYRQQIMEGRALSGEPADLNF